MSDDQNSSSRSSDQRRPFERLDRMLTDALRNIYNLRRLRTEPPAVEALEKIRYDLGTGQSDATTCTICLEEFDSGSELTRMPCSHVFHSDCLLTWLHNNVTCPLCRFKLRNCIT